MPKRKDYYQYLRGHIKIEDVCRKLDMQLRPVGEDYVCQCFSHSDSHPSMHIYTKENRFHCFQCGKNGDIFQLIKGKRSCNFRESLSWLEENFPDVLSEKPADFDNEQFCANGFEVAERCYKDMSPEERNALKIFAKERHYTLGELEKAEVYYSKKNKLKERFGGNRETIEECNLLQEAGLLRMLPRKEHDQSFEHYQDFFKSDRIIIILRDSFGKVVGFAGRSLSENDKPKYLFTKNLNKRNWLYGFYRIRRESAVQENVEDIYLVEGIFDALRLETKGKRAVAVMGSHILKGQGQILSDYVEQAGHTVRIYIFMDSDAPGLEGCYQSIKTLWKHSSLRRTQIFVNVLSAAKDPDEYFAKDQKETECFTYPAIEFLFRYLLCQDKEDLTGLDLAVAYKNKTTDEKIRVLHNIESLMSKDEWIQMFQWMEIVGEISAGEEDKQEFQPWDILKRYITESGKIQEYTYEKEKDYLFHMHTALEIVRTGYQREPLFLDEETWDRIAVSADAFFHYLYELLKKRQSFKEIPMIEIWTPKKRGVQRRKSFYIHEEILLQQYVLNELLSRGQYGQYEEFVPGVRYEESRGSYVTGYGAAHEVLSFAYQIDMDAVNGTKETRRGMFRPFYDCWKEYIQYVQEGIERLDGERVYKVKLDIKGFYDNIQKRVLRDALYPPIYQALLKDESKFQCFRNQEETEDNRAKLLVDWLLEELYKEQCYSAESGEKYIKEDPYCGIPQGPNLSAYAANVLLFQLDNKIEEIVDEVNKDCQDNKIAARYCRYVDDMIVISSDPRVLLRIKNAVAAALYDLGLELSGKTDEEEGVSKEEALEWTVDARGGLGVSAGYDIADDTMESVLDECDEYDTVDRREALKILRSIQQNILYGDNAERVLENIDEEQILDVIFRTEEIRINDIIRFSEFLIYRATEKEGNLWEKFEKLWDKGMAVCPEESVLQTEGIDIYVFLECCLKILQKKKRIEKESIHQVWEETAEKIKALFEENGVFTDILEKEIREKELLRTNGWILKLRYLQICCFLQIKKADPGNIAVSRQNEYSERWMWMLSSPESYSLVMNAGSVQCFQFMIARYQKARTIEDILEINSQIQDYHGEIIKNPEADLLTDCMAIWLNKERTTSESGGRERIALNVLLNLLQNKIKAEVIGNISLLSRYLFEGHDYPEILPVFPGVDYPGIMGYEKQDGVLEGGRIDFLAEEIHTGEDKKWEFIEEKRKDLKYYTAQWKGEKRQYISLEDYFGKENQQFEKRRANEETVQSIIEKVLEIHPILVEKIKKVYEKHPEERILLSKKNVFLGVPVSDGQEISVELGLSYLVSAQKTGDRVAEEREGRYILQQVNEEGAFYWIAGRLLADAIHLESINLQAGNGEEFDRFAEILRYSFKRLKGDYLHRSKQSRKTTRSYEKTMERTRTHMKNFLENKELRDLYQESIREEDHFIAFRLARGEYFFQDSSQEVAVWAKNCLRRGYKDLVKLMEEFAPRAEGRYSLERRVSKWYCCLADRLYQMGQKGGDFLQAIKTLAAGFFSDGILMNLRMQTLERIRDLENTQRKAFARRNNIPYRELGLDEKAVLITGNHQEQRWQQLWKNLLDFKTDKNLKNVTHLGWIVMLAKLYEIDTSEGWILPRNGNDSTVEECLENLTVMLTEKAEKKEKNLEFPYEDLEDFYLRWEPERVEKIIHWLNDLDKAWGIKVYCCRSQEYSQQIKNDNVIIGYDSSKGNLIERPYFLTYSKIDSGIFERERDLKNPEAFVYSMSKREDKILGISTIIAQFGELLQKWEADFEEKDAPPKAPSETDENCSIEEQIPSADPETDSGMPEKPEESDETKKEEFPADFGIHKMQEEFWKSRREKFANYDRIALFQFDIDSSYFPPSMERCKGKKENCKGEGKEGENPSEEYDGVEPSCAEYRRRMLLKPVLEACSLFGVEILLLPEYSVRPETVEWIAESLAEMMDNKKHVFSVWAGTFRIPAGHKFDSSGYWDKTAKLGGKDYYHSAVLPIVMPVEENQEKKITILSDKTKKYPSVALHEEINPVPGLYRDFIPVMKKRFKTFYDKNILIGDARDDVTELICAEVFAVSAVCNYPSFLKESYSAYKKYAAASAYKTEDKYIAAMFKDIKDYGTYTAIYQKEHRFLRTPIVLAPACTTRAADYYVWGQGQYLAAGLKMVLCNYGGSCFIGQDSWDNRKLVHDENKIDNTIYHGLKPGMYRQSSQHKDRGALGDHEQALLIYDVNPTYEKSKPTAESMLDALSLVAHIPVLEVDIHEKLCEGCKKRDIFKAKGDQEKTSKIISELLEYIDQGKKLGYRNTIDAEDKDKAAEKLKWLGETYQSEWLKRRGDYYEKYSKQRPERWPAPTLLDWLYIPIDYEKFMKAEKGTEEECAIQMSE